MDIRQIKEEQTKLNNLISKIKNRSALYPKGFICVITRNVNNVAFYYGCSENPRKLVHISKTQKELISELLQKRYDKLVLPKAKKQIKTLNYFMENYHPDELKEQIMKINSMCRGMIDVYDWPNEEYVKIWLSKNYNGNPYPFDNNPLVTNRGEKVRSKSEYIIANCLYEKNIPYRYEPPLETIYGKTIYPDFVLLNPKTREEIYWEHFGRMDNDSYREKAYKKLEDYAEIGITVGSNLIVTFEDYKNPLSIKLIKQVIKNRGLIPG